jgi:hypothetical protein
MADNDLIKSFLRTAGSEQTAALNRQIHEIISLPEKESILDDALREAIKAANYQSVNILLETGADPSRQNPRLPMTYACYIGDTRIVKSLISYGGRIQGERSKSYMGPLNLSVWHGYAEIVDILIKEGINLTKGQEQFSASLACAKNHPIILGMLLEAGSKLTFKNNPRNYPVPNIYIPAIQCIHSESMECLKLIYGLGEIVPGEALTVCGEMGNLEMLKYIYEQQGHAYLPVLTGACSGWGKEKHYNGQLKIIKYLLDSCNYKPNQDDIDKVMRLLILDWTSNNNILQWLTDYGFSITNGLFESIVQHVENISREQPKTERVVKSRLNTCNILN